ncbi:precorrin-6Y C5,15-methyltransferase (decarboxylating) [Marininema halotolerans]|uniref:Precorrin-6Y C5,15-methyltransferase (Decarboxylating) n=2 Tax=Marininema halotolerans TaxID=1155944 RepID=A0A1I6QM78_9BACL|nr:precorrin-6Y C5,15-methyltransferase (decarboxylating) [Marininema halotolerans]
MNKVKVIGIGDDGGDGLPPHYRQWIEEGEVIAGGERHLSFFPNHSGEKISFQGGIRPALLRVKEAATTRQVVVLASGDPFLYGIASLVIRSVGADKVEVHPHLSSVQLAFARMGESWQQAHVESIHGRGMNGLAQRVNGKEKIAILTDDHNTPRKLAAYLLQFGMSEYEAFVAENLGSPSEQCKWYDLERLAETDCSPLNVVILKRKPEVVIPHWGMGIDDHHFYQRRPEKGLITKKEVRVLSLAEMNLKHDSVVWDIGAGSGSVSVEASKLAPLGEVHAIEKNEADLENVTANRVKFRTDFTIVHGKAPAGLEAWPSPHAVFIGGSGGELDELLRHCCRRLLPGGRIVVNAVTIETLTQTLHLFQAEEFATRMTMLQVARSKPILSMTRMEGLNPVYVICGSRKEDHQ